MDKIRGCLLGLACGDAVGTTLEFSERGTFEPINDMIGGGPFQLEAGKWTDDTSMALCLAESLILCKGFDAFDQMERYVRWWQDGHRSSTDRCFDIGTTTLDSLARFCSHKDPYAGSPDPNRSGNGSIMRLAPIPLHYYQDAPQTIYFSGESSRTTHGSQRCIEACRLLGWLIHCALSGQDKKDFLFNTYPQELRTEINRLAKGDYANLSKDDVIGSGYVVESLEAALWCFWTGNTFRETILLSANLGDDADTTAAVAGQLAGAYYGESAIPPEWLQKLYLAEEIGELAEQLVRN